MYKVIEPIKINKRYYNVGDTVPDEYVSPEHLPFLSDDSVVEGAAIELETPEEKPAETETKEEEQEDKQDGKGKKGKGKK